MTILRVIPTPALTIFPIIDGDEPKVVMFRRPPSDPFWPGQLHFPGKVALAGESDEALQWRVVDDELGGRNNIASLERADWALIPRGTGERESLRGTEAGLLCFCEWVGEEPLPGMEVVDLYNLPPDVIGFHRSIFAPRVIAWYEKNRKRRK